MLTAAKALLKMLLVPGIYLGVLFVCLWGMARRAEWPLYLLAFLAPIPTLWYPLHQLPLGNSTLDLLFVATAIGIVVNKGGFAWTRSTATVGAFVGCALVGLIIVTVRFNLPAPITTANPVLADWKNYIEMILLYFLANGALRTERDQQRMVTLMALVIFLLAFREFRNFSQGAGFSYDRRAEGPFWIVGLGANHFAAFIAHFGGLIFGMLLVERHKARRRLYLAACLFSLHPLFFAYSRGAWLAVVAVLFTYGVLRKRAILAALVVLALFWQLLLPQTVVERIEMTETSDGQLEDSAAERLNLWQHAKQVFSENALFGLGYSGFKILRTGEPLTDTHNFYMKVAADQGLLGLVALGLLLLGALRSGWTLYRVANTEFHSALGFGFVGCTIAVLVTNVFGDRFSYFALNCYFFIAWGMVDRAIALASLPSLGPVPDNARMVNPLVVSRN